MNKLWPFGRGRKTREEELTPRILRRGVEEADDESSGNGSNTGPDNGIFDGGNTIASRIIAASNIVGAAASVPNYPYIWLCASNIRLSSYTPINTIGPPSGTDVENAFNPIPLLFTLLTKGVTSFSWDISKKGHLNSDNIETFVKIYGLRPQVISTFISTAPNTVTVSKKVFEAWLASTPEIDLFAIRRPFLLLRLVSECFRNGSFDCQNDDRVVIDDIQGCTSGSKLNDLNIFMRSIFLTTFGKKMRKNIRLFSHIALVECLNSCDTSNDSVLPSEFLLTWARVWGLDEPAAQKLVGGGSLNYIQLCRLFFQVCVPSIQNHFPLIDRDKDGFLSETEIREFVNYKFDQQLSEEEIKMVIRNLDFDNDGRLGGNDFRTAVYPLFDGTSWETWLVGTVIAIFIAADPTSFLVMNRD